MVLIWTDLSKFNPSMSIAYWVILHTNRRMKV